MELDESEAGQFLESGVSMSIPRVLSSNPNRWEM
jgi:hypothetical protein